MFSRKRLLIVSAVLLIAGCATWYETTPGGDPNDPNDIVLSAEGKQIETLAQGGAAVAQGASILWAPAGLISGALVSFLGAMRKYKPQIKEAKTQSESFYAVASTLVHTIEKLKTNYPQDWESHLEPLLKKYIDPKGNVEAVIRALRGVPPVA